MSTSNIGSGSGGGHGGSTSSSSSTKNDIFLGFKKASQRLASAVADTGAKTLLKVRREIIVYGFVGRMVLLWALFVWVLEPRYSHNMESAKSERAREREGEVDRKRGRANWSSKGG